MISKAGLSETLMWRARAGQARRVAMPACCLHETLRSLKPTPENAMTVPAQPLSKALGSIRVDRSRSNVGTIEALGRQPKVVSQIKPHEHAALVGGPPSFLIDATLGHTRCWARYRADRSGSTADSNQGAAIIWELLFQTAA
jgi:hypothetical protein